uniref:imelysin family protein n=1 Tax=Aliarcobacter sp. TaxID=2321116 RepID=UPI004047882D
MKKMLFLMLFCTTLVFAEQKALGNIIKNISLPNVQTAINSAESLKKDINSENFTKFIRDWKKVEATYFAGDLDENHLDTPRYMDIFNNLKEDLNSQMKRVIESNDEVEVALFKNSFKTVNALEYILFNDKIITSREKELSIVILDSLISHLKDIKETYSNYLLTEGKGEKWENSLILNTLISSSFKLKEWRIGHPSGNSAKFKNDAKNERGEYFLSQNSFEAIDAILDAHKEILLKNDYYDFATYVLDKGAAIELLSIVDNINEMKEELKSLKKDDFSKAKKLFDKANYLHNAYYTTLIEKLRVTAKILDADGD